MSFTLPTKEQMGIFSSPEGREYIEEQTSEEGNEKIAQDKKKLIEQKVKEVMENNKPLYLRMQWINQGIHVKTKIPMFQGCLFKDNKKKIQSVSIPQEPLWQKAMIMKLLSVNPLTEYLSCPFYFKGHKLVAYYRREQQSLEGYPQFWPTNKLLLSVTGSDIQGPVLICHPDQQSLSVDFFSS